ncbi:xanthine dehydrogenase family protein molybdopterin-binding subunit [Methylobacterium gnaphalii]|uniref:Dehydrogenase n=1 Tax=Methylobacterium gnaphalii TaxID=1010610 RepID=A0A512JEP0_9HYPH|nr:xanthine dehydrogenase family protein molybdopterin-binding subunit [Methylobacterium gnaphalii]GEP08413.1 dehydrogenase [Methylobacterium gnaphalii]GJD68875.1 Aldehyde oxidoreductase molybdenum-binding subunit PaoC [Methylobacterium gnaphalii]GLS47398.1 dehydrogenase [Methylobacterium gnaphalii]
MATQFSTGAGEDRFVGRAVSRVDGPAKVTGLAKYAGEFSAENLAHGYVVSSSIARGRITSIDTAAAEAVPGVLKVITHKNRPSVAGQSKAYQDMVAPPGSPFRALYDETIVFSGQPVALVVAEDFDTARHAASLVTVAYEAEPPRTDIDALSGDAYKPPMEREGIKPPPEPRGDAEAAFGKAPIRVEGQYRLADEHHNPMEPHASTVVVEDDGTYTVYDKIQGVANTQLYLTNVFGLKPEQVRCLNPYLGGGFGSGLRPQYQLFLAMLAAQDLKRSVRVTLTRDQMWSFTFRSQAVQTISLGADENGGLQAIRHDAVQGTSTYEDYQEVVVNWSGVLYKCDNVKLSYKLVKLDTPTPGDMRAPGAVSGVFAIETAMDEMACATGLDPIELRLKNYTEADQTEGKPFGSKALKSCFSEGAERFGWSKRSPEPRSMRDGKELVGWGMASGIWESMMMKSSAQATLTADGRLEIGNSTGDIGTGTYTILTQIAADTLGLPIEHITTKLGDTELAQAPVAGGSWTAASSGTAVMKACRTIAEQVFKLARGLPDSPLANVDFERAVFTNGRIEVAGDPSRSVGIVDVLKTTGTDKLEATETASPDKDFKKQFEAYTHSAIFAEVKVDEELGRIRVTRIVSAIAAGKILNTKTARSQILGGVVMGIGSALHEESMLDHRLGRFMNHNLGEYHVPAHADIYDIDVIFVDEEDMANPLGVKGLGEIGIVGTAAAIGNAVYHATGKRIRNLPITVDKILG